jgi:hypothetical protein
LAEFWQAKVYSSSLEAVLTGILRLNLYKIFIRARMFCEFKTCTAIYFCKEYFLDERIIDE